MKKYLLFLLISVFTIGLTSCSDDDEPAADPRDQYVGTWNNNQVGSLTLFQNGTSVGTVAIDTSYTVLIKKSGNKNLIIDDKLFFVNDKNLSSDPESISQTFDGGNLVGTSTASGTLSNNIITIKISFTGTWSNTFGASGNFSGTEVATLRR